jgi:hypothetical protein
VDLYIHSSIRLHGVVLKQLSTGTTLPFTLPQRVRNFMNFLFHRRATDWTAAVRFPAGVKFFFIASREALKSTQSPVQCIPGALSHRIKLLGRETDHSPPTSAEVKNRGAILALPNRFSWHSS